jgi:hypothetical protein
MKIIAKPMEAVSSSEITKQNILQSSLGHKILALIEDGIKNKFLAYTSVEDCLKKFQTQMLFGTCVGQSSAIIIANRSFQNNDPKALLPQASKIDVICYQLLSNLNAAIEGAIYVKNLSKKINDQLGYAGKKTAKKLKKEKKELHKETKLAGEFFAMPIKKLSTKDLPSIKEFRKKISDVARSCLEEQSGYTWVGNERITSNKKAKFVQLITRLQEKKEEDTALKVTFAFRGAVGHALALFPTKRFMIYDSKSGLAEAGTKQDFIQAVQKLYDAYFHHQSGTIEVEVFTASLYH